MNYDVYGIGNALVDMEFKVTEDFFKDNNVEKGLMTLVEEDRQDELTAALAKQNIKSIKSQCGGSAANTMIGISQFGGKSFYSCKVANDETGKFYLNDLKENNVTTKLTEATAPNGTTGKCLVLVTPDADRTMNTFLGITASYSEEELDLDALKASKYLYVEGYLVASPTGQKAAVAAIKFARKNNVKTSLTMSDPNMVKFFKSNLDEIMDGGIDLLFCNEDEAIEYTGKTKIDAAKEDLKKIANNFVITLGSKGAMIWDGKVFVNIEPFKTEAIDTNGAGDMFAGAFLYGINNGLSMATAGKLASRAASVVVSQFGPRLEKAQATEIHEQVFNKI